LSSNPHPFSELSLGEVVFNPSQFDPVLVSQSDFLHKIGMQYIHSIL
jgi:hypothetical protein